ncbi:hypothetical protein D3C78_1286600 [compost metagenome]
MKPACGSESSPAWTAATARMPASAACSASTPASRPSASIAMPPWGGSTRPGLPAWRCPPNSPSLARKARRKLPPCRKPSSERLPRMTTRRPLPSTSPPPPKTGIWPLLATCATSCRAGRVQAIRCSCICWKAPSQHCPATRRTGWQNWPSMTCRSASTTPCRILEHWR